MQSLPSLLSLSLFNVVQKSLARWNVHKCRLCSHTRYSPTSNLVLSWTWTNCLYASCRIIQTAQASLLLKLSSCFAFSGSLIFFRSSISSLSHSLSLSLSLSLTYLSVLIQKCSLLTLLRPSPTTSYLSVVVKFHSVCYQHNRPLEAQYLLCNLSLSLYSCIFPPKSFFTIFSYRSLQAIFSSLLYRSFFDL